MLTHCGSTDLGNVVEFYSVILVIITHCFSVALMI